MPDMRTAEKAFIERAAPIPGEGPDPTAVRAVAVCTCGGINFVLKIYSCGYYQPHCISCDSTWKEWPPKSGGQGEDAGGSEAVAEVGNEPGDLVQTEEIDPKTIARYREIKKGLK